MVLAVVNTNRMLVFPAQVTEVGNQIWSAMLALRHVNLVAVTQFPNNKRC
jgi:hypothetical protein